MLSVNKNETSSNVSSYDSTKENKGEEVTEKKRSGYEASQLNKQKQIATIIEDHISISTTEEENSRKLLYKTALDAINKELEAEFGPDAAEKIKNSGTDTSPQATADRIVNFATSLYQKFSELNPDMPEEERVDKFLALVGGGVDKGFDEARKVLDGLGVLDGKLSDDIDSTYSKVQDGFAKFREMILGSKDEQSDAEDSKDIENSVSRNTTDQLHFSMKV